MADEEGLILPPPPFFFFFFQEGTGQRGRGIFEKNKQTVGALYLCTETEHWQSENEKHLYFCISIPFAYGISLKPTDDMTKVMSSYAYLRSLFKCMEVIFAVKNNS